MEHLLIQTSGGPLGFVGRLHTDQVRPSLLVVTGSFPPDGYLHGLVSDFPGANVLIANMPGMSKVFWADEPSVTGITKGLEDALRLLLPDMPIVAFGSSTGNILSLGLRLPNICHRVADEPFFQTEDLWPFIANSRERMRLNPSAAHMARYFWEYFGIGPDRLENRDYRYLLDNITVPTDVVVGQSALLPVRGLPIWPSFTSTQDRAKLAENPLVTLHQGPAGSGHSYGSKPEGSDLLKRLLHAALLKAAKA
jgi:pimeloyl-ACP methyl ester carboxylesterase